MVGDSAASASYVKRKIEVCDEIGIVPKLFHLSDGVEQEEVVRRIQGLNGEEEVDGILVQVSWWDAI